MYIHTCVLYLVLVWQVSLCVLMCIFLGFSLLLLRCVYQWNRFLHSKCILLCNETEPPGDLGLGGASERPSWCFTWVCPHGNIFICSNLHVHTVLRTVCVCCRRLKDCIVGTRTVRLRCCMRMSWFARYY